eukprot:1466087-Prymnesium_polylepis.1
MIARVPPFARPATALPLHASYNRNVALRYRPKASAPALASSSSDPCESCSTRTPRATVASASRRSRRGIVLRSGSCTTISRLRSCRPPQTHERISVLKNAKEGTQRGAWPSPAWPSPSSPNATPGRSRHPRSDEFRIVSCAHPSRLAVRSACRRGPNSHAAPPCLEARCTLGAIRSS